MRGAPPVVSRARAGMLAALAAFFGTSAVPAAQHSVIVADNFFSPAELTIEVGDTVRWSNGAGFHNVYSCTATQAGCSGEAAIETFSSGAPRNGPWFYTHTFTEVGENPYVCQSHASFMQGRVIVRAPAGPPAVPDGIFGAPATVDRLDVAGEILEVAWDDRSCLAPAYHLLWGRSDDLPAAPGATYDLSGAVCGTATPFVWSASPAVPSSGDWVWWLIVASDGAGSEGAWGSSTAGERDGPFEGGSSGACGIEAKIEPGACTP